MSYDIYLRSEPCDKCGRGGEEPELPNPTYNLTPIFDLALTGEPLPNPHYVCNMARGNDENARSPEQLVGKLLRAAYKPK